MTRPRGPTREGKGKGVEDQIHLSQQHEPAPIGLRLRTQPLARRPAKERLASLRKRARIPTALGHQNKVHVRGCAGAGQERLGLVARDFLDYSVCLLPWQL